MAVTRASTSYAAGATDCSCDRTASGVQDGVAAVGPTAAAPRVACLAPAVKAAAIVNGTMSLDADAVQTWKAFRSQQLSIELLTAGQPPFRHVLILCAHACVLHISTTKPSSMSGVRCTCRRHGSHYSRYRCKCRSEATFRSDHHACMTPCSWLQAGRTQLVVESHLNFGQQLDAGPVLAHTRGQHLQGLLMQPLLLWDAFKPAGKLVDFCCQVLYLGLNAQVCKNVIQIRIMKSQWLQNISIWTSYGATGE
jgi:hypothetical protein